MYQKMTKKELIKILEVRDSETIRAAKDVLKLLSKYRALPQEYFIVITLNSSHQPINVHEVSKGLVNRTLIHPREVFRAALLDNAESIILAHNHPSGKSTPSAEDREFTKRLNSAGEIVGIQVMDHLILGIGETYSFEGNGIL